MYFDIGSNIGKWTLANINNCDKIISIEASSIIYNNLVKNCKNNKIITLNYAVCNNNCEDITFYQAKCDVLSTINKDWLTKETSRFYNQPYSETRCKTITIDKLIEMYGVPDLIKIDVEGGEYECITSLTQKVNMLCFEWASETNNITFKCIDYLYDLGFREYYIQNCDDYIFRPNDTDYYNIISLKSQLENTIPKTDWGMIWCKNTFFCKKK
jgi:FkbM family methyltransferase